MIASLCWAVLFAAPACAAQPGTAETWDAAEADIARCFDAMDRDPALGRVNAKYARRNPTEAQLADPSFVSEAEAAALRLRVAKTRSCRDVRLDAVARFRPLLDPSYRILYYQADQVMSYLTEGLIGYGLANRLALESFRAFEARGDAFAKTADQAALSETWAEMLQRAHSNPPPDRPVKSCHWEDLNLACER
jgi:hypothetical protein